MSTLSRLFGRGGPGLDLDPLMQTLHARTRLLADPAAPLVRARLADACRDAGLAPVGPAHFEARFAALCPEGWRRLGLAVELVRALDPAEELRPLAGETGADRILGGVAGTVEATGRVTIEILRGSALRIEEFARHLVAHLGASVAGESAAESAARLERLDYARLLAEAERARDSAEERLEYLRKLQADVDARFQPRGKW